jgi:DNA replication initiation complex subunit (GINS family)
VLVSPATSAAKSEVEQIRPEQLLPEERQLIADLQGNNH